MTATKSKEKSPCPTPSEPLPEAQIFLIVASPARRLRLSRVFRECSVTSKSSNNFSRMYNFQIQIKHDWILVEAWGKRKQKIKKIKLEINQRIANTNIENFCQNKVSDIFNSECVNSLELSGPRAKWGYLCCCRSI